MSTTLAAKRMAKERAELEKPNGDYFVHFKDEDLLHFDAYVAGPSDTPYQHKLALLRLEIPARYPLVPPTVKFIQHSGGRIHPNLYVEGKVCLSILGTWPGEPWAYGMTCHTVLVTIRSLLDDQPYKHEPGQHNNPSFNKFVEYSTWTCMLFDYLWRAPNEASKVFITSHIRENAEKMRADLAAQALKNEHLRRHTSPYLRSGTHDSLMIIDYPKLQNGLEAAIAMALQAGPVSGSASSKRPVEAVQNGPNDEESTIERIDGSTRKRCRIDTGDARSNDRDAARSTTATPRQQHSNVGSNPATKQIEIIDLT